MFNGASNIAQEGAFVALSLVGQKKVKISCLLYGECKIIKQNLVKMGFKVLWGDNAPYLG